MKSYRSRTWVNPKLIAGESKIHHDGVLAAAPIRRGEKLMEFGGRIITRHDADEGPYRVRSIWAIGADAYLALPESDTAPSLDENLNHSCDANSWLVGDVLLVARRDIALGEEITLDQGTWNFEESEYTVDAIDCTCGAPSCRRRLTENDWQLPALRKRYKGHIHPIVQAMIDAERAPAPRRRKAA
jgi:uncharacterized protein